MFGSRWQEEWLVRQRRHGSIGGATFDLEHPDLDPIHWQCPELFGDGKFQFKGSNLSFGSLLAAYSEPWSPDPDDPGIGEGDLVFIDSVERRSMGDRYRSHPLDQELRIAKTKIAREVGPNGPRLTEFGPDLIFLPRGTVADGLHGSGAYTLVVDRLCNVFGVQALADAELPDVAAPEGITDHEGALIIARQIDEAIRQIVSRYGATEEPKGLLDYLGGLESQVQSLVSHAVVLGYEIAKGESSTLSPLLQSAVKHREGGKTGGEASAVSRRGKQEIWQGEVREILAVLMPSKAPVSADKLAQLVASDWQDQGGAQEPPSHSSLTKFIAWLVAKGELDIETGAFRNEGGSLR